MQTFYFSSSTTYTQIVPIIRKCCKPLTKKTNTRANSFYIAGNLSLSIYSLVARKFSSLTQRKSIHKLLYKLCFDNIASGNDTAVQQPLLFAKAEFYGNLLDMK